MVMVLFRMLRLPRHRRHLRHLRHSATCATAPEWRLWRHTACPGATTTLAPGWSCLSGAAVAPRRRQPMAYGLWPNDGPARAHMTPGLSSRPLARPLVATVSRCDTSVVYVTLMWRLLCDASVRRVSFFFPRRALRCLHAANRGVRCKANAKAASGTIQLRSPLQASFTAPALMSDSLASSVVLR